MLVMRSSEAGENSEIRRSDKKYITFEQSMRSLCDHESEEKLQGRC
jgi:hypothetical protein